MNDKKFNISYKNSSSDFDRELSWVQFKITLSRKQTLVYSAITKEYFEDTFKNSMTKDALPTWIEEVKNKWLANYNKIGDEIFDSPIHFECYTNSDEGEKNCIDYLVDLYDK